jgi:hypothetical protein
MRLYKLLRDTPTIKAGTIFREVVSDYDGARELARVTPIGAKTSPQFTIQDIDNFDEWFEEIKGPVDGIHWKPKFGDIYWCIDSDGEIIERRWQNDEVNKYDYLSANTYNDLKEIDDYELEDNGYVIIDGNCIYKIELDKEFDMDSNFVEVAKTQDDTYEFITWFYNNSTDLQEMLQKGFNQAEKGNDKCFKDGREI